MIERKLCEVCGSDKFVDEHHYDCREGQLSTTTIPLCRRCHRTYHNYGVDWFDDKYLGKAIDIENKKRQIHRKHSSNPLATYALPSMKREDVRRSDYWNKIHGTKSKRKQPRETPSEKQLGFDMIDTFIKDDIEKG